MEVEKLLTVGTNVGVIVVVAAAVGTRLTGGVGSGVGTWVAVGTSPTGGVGSGVGTWVAVGTSPTGGVGSGVGIWIAVAKTTISGTGVAVEGFAVGTDSVARAECSKVGINTGAAIVGVPVGGSERVDAGDALSGVFVGVNTDDVCGATIVSNVTITGELTVSTTSGVWVGSTSVVQDANNAELKTAKNTYGKYLNIKYWLFANPS